MVRTERLRDLFVELTDFAEVVVEIHVLGVLEGLTLEEILIRIFPSLLLFLEATKERLVYRSLGNLPQLLSFLPCLLLVNFGLLLHLRPD